MLVNIFKVNEEKHVTLLAILIILIEETGLLSGSLWISIHRYTYNAYIYTFNSL